MSDPESTCPTPLEKSTPASSDENSKSRSRLKFVLAFVIAVGLIFGFVQRWLEHRRAVSVEEELATPVVSVVFPVAGTNAAGLMLPAEIRPWREASIYSRASGFLKDWQADIGAHVQAGALLAEIETPDLDQQLAQAQAQLVLAQANLHLAEVTDNRWQGLLKTASVSEQEAEEKTATRETAAAQVEAEQANVRRLEELVSFQNVVAPFTGTITLRNTDNGDLIIAGAGGKELFHIAQADKLRVYIRVPESFASAVTVGQTATLTAPALPGQKFVAKVTTSSEAISDVSRTLLVELELENSQHALLPYSFGQVSLTRADRAPALTLPSNVMLFRAPGLQVAVVRPDNIVELHSIEVGRDFGQTIEILSGVTTSDQVIVNPPDSLVNGALVHIQPESQRSTKK